MQYCMMTTHLIVFWGLCFIRMVSASHVYLMRDIMILFTEISSFAYLSISSLILSLLNYISFKIGYYVIGDQDIERLLLSR